MSVSRLFEIVYLLLERRQMTAEALAHRFEVSVRTIYRDIDALSAAGIPVFAIQGRGGGISLMDHCVLDKAVFSTEEQTRLLTALQSIPGAAEPENREVLSKLAGLFGRKEPDWLTVDFSRWGTAAGDDAKFQQLKEAILSHQVISFTYMGTYGATQDRRVLPARLAFKGKAWYLQGWCLAREDYRTFRITRMLVLVLTGEFFTQALTPPPIEPEGGDPRCSVPVRLRFAPWMAYRVYDEFAPDCIQRAEDGSVTVEVSFPEDQWLYGYLLSFGVGVEVLSPAALRTRLGLLAKEIWRGCQNLDSRRQVLCGTMEPSQIQEDKHMNEKFCQSCGMPLQDASLLGTETDGAPSEHYCKYCYQGGAFTSDMTMEEMIDFCTPIMAQNNPEMTEEQARAQMLQFFPMLMRWKK